MGNILVSNFFNDDSCSCWIMLFLFWLSILTYFIYKVLIEKVVCISEILSKLQSETKKKPYFFVFLVKFFFKITYKGYFYARNRLHASKTLENASQIVKYQIVIFSSITKIIEITSV